MTYLAAGVAHVVRPGADQALIVGSFTSKCHAVVRQPGHDALAVIRLPRRAVARICCVKSSRLAF
jgi:hypothetical protein